MNIDRIPQYYIEKYGIRQAGNDLFISKPQFILLPIDNSLVIEDRQYELMLSTKKAILRLDFHEVKSHIVIL